ncbi:MAG: hypothetical protein ACLT1W_13285 [Alistipes onderdonkii]
MDFPGEFIEGYAYLQSKFYGHLPGTIYGREARLWMPTGLATPADRQLNYISAVDDDALYIVFMNQFVETVETDVAAGLRPERTFRRRALQDAGHSGSGASGQLADGRFTVRVAGNGIAAVRIETPTPVRPQLAALFTAETLAKPLRRNAGRRRTLHAGRFLAGPQTTYSSISPKTTRSCGKSGSP